MVKIFRIATMLQLFKSVQVIFEQVLVLVSSKPLKKGKLQTIEPLCALIGGLFFEKVKKNHAKSPQEVWKLRL